jgi:hypothetical protein
MFFSAKLQAVHFSPASWSDISPLQRPPAITAPDMVRFSPSSRANFLRKIG